MSETPDIISPCAGEPNSVDTIGEKNPHPKENELAVLRKTNIALESRNFELREQVRQLRLQTAAAESQRDQYKREIKKLRDELNDYRGPPLFSERSYPCSGPKYHWPAVPLPGQ